LETDRLDINEIKRYIHMNGYDRNTIKKLIRKIFYPCDETSTNSGVCKLNKNQIKDELCHNIGLPVDELVEFLDITEETITTLLCYLQAANYIKLYRNNYKTCTVRTYKGLSYLKNDLAKTNPFVQVLLKNRVKGGSSSSNVEEFDVDIMEICDDLQADYATVRQELRKIQWVTDTNGKFVGKSGVGIELRSMSFCLVRKCVSDDNELDVMYDYLWDRVSKQMNSTYVNFKALYKILSENSLSTVGEYLDHFIRDDNENITRSNDNGNGSKVNKVQKYSDTIKINCNDYFNNRMNINQFTLGFNFNCESDISESMKQVEMSRLTDDINRFINTYAHEMKLNGHVIAKIFHGN
jgi:ATP-dependent DNA helicase Q4